MAPPSRRYVASACYQGKARPGRGDGLSHDSRRTMRSLFSGTVARGGLWLLDQPSGRQRVSRLTERPFSRTLVGFPRLSPYHSPRGRAVSLRTGPLRRTSSKLIALYVPLPWPAAVTTRPGIDQVCAGSAPTGFAADVEQLDMLLERLAMRDRRDQWPEHPIFGGMYLHADHHLRQFGA